MTYLTTLLRLMIMTPQATQAQQKFQAKCECGWKSGPCKSEEAARESAFRNHVSVGANPGHAITVRPFAARPKYQSRAARLDAAMATISTSELEDLKSELEEYIEKWESFDNDGDDTIIEQPGEFIIRKLRKEGEEGSDAYAEIDVSEVESLKDEMESWRDNMESGNLENTPKYEEVNECADALDTLYSAVEEANENIQNIPDKVSTKEEAEEALEAVEAAIEGIESAESEASSVNFPGMY